MKLYQTIVRVSLGFSIMAAIAFVLFSSRPAQILDAYRQSGAAPVVEQMLPVEGQVFHAHYRHTNAINPGGESAGWGTANQNTETWWRIGKGQSVTQIFNRVTDDNGRTITEVFFDGAGKMYQYWNQRDELWIEPDKNIHVLAIWSPKVIADELTANGIEPARQTQIAGNQTLIMERQTKDPPPAGWLSFLPSDFQNALLVRRVFVGQAPIQGLDLGLEDVFVNQANAEFVAQSYWIISWDVISESQAGSIFEWKVPTAKTIVDRTTNN